MALVDQALSHVACKIIWQTNVGDGKTKASDKLKNSTTPRRSIGLEIPSRLNNVLSVGLAAALAIVLVANFIDWLYDASFAAQYGHQIGFAEGVVWQQALMILRGEGYSDIKQLPFVVFHYPPIFHLLTGMFAWVLNVDFLMADRIVSVSATICTACVIGKLVYDAVLTRNRLMTSLFCAFAAGLIPFLFNPIATWAPMMRVDMTSVFFSFLGVYFGLRAPEQPRFVYISALFFVLALYTKQTAIAAPMATLVILTLIKPRLAVVGFLVAIGSGLTAMVLFQLTTNGEFLNHLVSYNINRFRIDKFSIITNTIARHIFYALITFSFVVGQLFVFNQREKGRNALQHLSQILSTDRYARLEFFVFLFIILTTLFLVSIFKSGSDVNYFIETMFGWSVAIALTLRRPSSNVANLIASHPSHKITSDVAGLCGPYLRFSLPIVLAALLFQSLVHSPPGPRSLIAQLASQEQQNMLLERVRSASKPVISDNMVVVLQSGKEVIWESAIFNELAALGKWDQTPFIEMITAKKFAFFITQGREGDPLFDNRYSASVLRAIKHNYPYTEGVAGYVIHSPAK